MISEGGVKPALIWRKDGGYKNYTHAWYTVTQRCVD